MLKLDAKQLRVHAVLRYCCTTRMFCRTATRRPVVSVPLGDEIRSNEIGLAVSECSHV